LALSAEMLVMANAASSMEEARTKLQAAIDSGAAVAVLEKMIEAHGGDPAIAAHPERLVEAERVREILAPASGFVTGVDAFALGKLGVALGAGRTRADQPVDHAVGLYVRKKPGDAVSKGEVLAVARVRTEAQEALAATQALAAFSIADAPPKALPLVVERMTGEA
jgi:pyrimidine-nucleoside phosphorylase